MPVIEPGSWMHPGSKPEWSEIGTIGRFAVSVDGGRFDRHHHDDHEIWFIAEGKGKVFVDGADEWTASLG